MITEIFSKLPKKAKKYEKNLWLKVVHPDNLNWIGERVLKKWGVAESEARTIIASAIKTEVNKKYDMKREPRTSVSVEYDTVKIFFDPKSVSLSKFIFIAKNLKKISLWSSKTLN